MKYVYIRKGRKCDDCGTYKLIRTRMAVCPPNYYCIKCRPMGYDPLKPPTLRRNGKGELVFAGDAARDWMSVHASDMFELYRSTWREP